MDKFNSPIRSIGWYLKLFWLILLDYFLTGNKEKYLL